MHSPNHWGGPLEIHGDTDSNRVTEHPDHDDHQLDETQQGWLLGLQHDRKNKKKGRAMTWTVLAVVAALILVGLIVVIFKMLPAHKSRPPPPDDYAVALHKALLYFNAQKSGKLPKDNGVPWRGDSGLSDGSETTDVNKGGLVGGYYDAGDNTKFHFPISFTMTMLSWTVIEYNHKYEAIGEYDHVRELIKWGTDYLLLTFDSSADTIDKIYSQVGGSEFSGTPDDYFCWQRPEVMDYPRPVQTATSGPDLAGEMAAALASASIVFRDDPTYSKKLVKAAKTLFKFATDPTRQTPYSRGNPWTELFYNSTGFYDELMWGATWLYYATGNETYLKLATDPSLVRDSKALTMARDSGVLYWDNKLPAVMLLLTRLRIMLNPGYPYEDMLRMYHNMTGLTMCSYLRQYHVFNWTKGGMIELNHGGPQPLQYVVFAAFLSSLFVDYLNATGVPGWSCGPDFIPSDVLRNFATSQINYILGDNPMNMSYVVGYGPKFPTRVHHRGASTPHEKNYYSCTEGRQWRDTPDPDPHTIIGAMVAGPDRFDRYVDFRPNYNFTEPITNWNAGLVAALVSLTSSGGPRSIDKNTMFSGVPPLFSGSPPPPPPWKPH